MEGYWRVGRGAIVIRKAEAAGELAAEIGLRAALLAGDDADDRPGDGAGKPARELTRCLRLLTQALARLTEARTALAAASGGQSADREPSPLRPRSQHHAGT